MSLSSAYSEVRYVDVVFKDGTHINIPLQIPLNLILDLNNADISYENVIEFNDETKSRLQKEYVRNWIKRNLQNVAEIDDDWCE